MDSTSTEHVQKISSRPQFWRSSLIHSQLKNENEDHFRVTFKSITAGVQLWKIQSGASLLFHLLHCVMLMFTCMSYGNNFSWNNISATEPCYLWRIFGFAFFFKNKSCFIWHLFWVWAVFTNGFKAFELFFASHIRIIILNSWIPALKYHYFTLNIWEEDSTGQNLPWGELQ